MDVADFRRLVVLSEDLEQESRYIPFTVPAHDAGNRRRSQPINVVQSGHVILWKIIELKRRMLLKHPPVVGTQSEIAAARLEELVDACSKLANWKTGYQAQVYRRPSGPTGWAWNFEEQEAFHKAQVENLRAARARAEETIERTEFADAVARRVTEAQSVFVHSATRQIDTASNGAHQPSDNWEKLRALKHVLKGRTAEAFKQLMDANWNAPLRNLRGSWDRTKSNIGNKIADAGLPFQIRRFNNCAIIELVEPSAQKPKKRRSAVKRARKRSI
jgi:hypothetical protein